MLPADALKCDYESTLGFINKCDDHMFKIRNWALVTTSAIIAFSFSRDEDLIILVNLVLILAFLYMELIYKSFQDTAVEHATDLAERIDRQLLGDTLGVIKGYRFGFGRKLQYPSLKQVGKVLFNKRRLHIVSLYALIAAFSVGAYFIALKVA